MEEGGVWPESSWLLGPGRSKDTKGFQGTRVPRAQGGERPQFKPQERKDEFERT